MHTISLRRNERIAIVLGKRKERFDFTSERILLARKMARNRASVAQIAEAVGWTGCMSGFAKRLRKLNIIAGQMKSAVEYGA